VAMTKGMGIEKWEEMKVCVSRGGIWHERLYGRAIKELWDEIVMQRSILDCGQDPKLWNHLGAGMNWLLGACRSSWGSY
jgi:hypothetical protein